jgi:hypothetical protein
MPDEGGSIYREYVIAESEPASDSDFREFASPAAQPQERKSSKPKGKK